MEALKQGMGVAISARNIKWIDCLPFNPQDLLVLQSDVRNVKDEENAITQIMDRWGTLDVLLVTWTGSVILLLLISWPMSNGMTMIDTNLTGVFNSVKAAIPALKKSVTSYIITIASLAGTNFFAQGATYNASKFGLVGFTQAIMLDLRPYKIKVSTIMQFSCNPISMTIFQLTKTHGRYTRRHWSTRDRLLKMNQGPCPAKSK